MRTSYLLSAGARTVRAGACPVLFAVASVSLVEPALAETVNFNARIQVTIPRGDLCPGGALICGAAMIAGFGSAEYRFTVTSLEASPGACSGPGRTAVGGAYLATTTFTLSDGSVLEASEEGVVCGPGLSLEAPASWRTFGNPVDGNGHWVIQSATGQFAGLTGGGTDSFHTAGANFSATYTGSLQR